MNQNGFSTGEEDSRGPLDKICCLQEDGFRCQRQAGNASYSKKIRNTVRQLKLHLDAVARHIYICDHHKSMIQSARTLKPSSQDEAPEVDFSQLQMNTLRRYKKHFKVVTKPSLNKAQMAETLLNHFKTISVNEKEALTFFIYTIKTNGNKLDQKNGNNNSDTPS
ncbi:PREDICTED: histone deacetylase complex subunit SAP30 homolog [Diuraphis noxia]|uniref:histone deacetylase complex subunit SAP30 homolog n=1 Tax=Diuraphis noxia TaxID=143948 RepID=UPI0007639A83|nr:PREDICTED: histone deacetylase complex subunit SAP30 homolog [Diuraphis noxia]XP_015376071.1 PREDICTED: histone deacetylase complex subunit SAP30 homolog [Diuraphis noxia]XP_022178950.1 histone deacetylase complex subunit SAP30 homolog [Myzus persicae]XP_022178951.1 histone deacetylase complex subunit SAP30 homolog [Myzus persicae]